MQYILGERMEGSICTEKKPKLALIAEAENKLNLSLLKKEDIEQKQIILFETPLQTYEIQNRRYLGNKYKLLSFIQEILENNCTNIKVFCDIFAGTGVVGSHFNKQYKIISNDILYCNYIALNAASKVKCNR